MGILCQVMAYLLVHSGCINNMPARTDPQFSLWPPLKTKKKKTDPQSVNPVSFLNFFPFPVPLRGTLQCKFWFGQFGLLLSVSQANWCLLQLPCEGREGGVECVCVCVCMWLFTPTSECEAVLTLPKDSLQFTYPVVLMLWLGRQQKIL